MDGKLFGGPFFDIKAFGFHGRVAAKLQERLQREFPNEQVLISGSWDIALSTFQQLIEKYPHSQYVGDSHQRMIYLRNRLADFELHVALYYMRRGAYVGAINRAKFCVENYDGAPAVKGSMKVLVDAYRNLHMMDLASNAERVYADNYPGDTKDILRKKHWWAIF